VRVGDHTLFLNLLSGLASSREATARAVASLGDGKRVRMASDDPVGARSAIAFRGRLAAIEGYGRSGAAARTDLSTLDSVLGEVVNILSSVRAEAMAGASGTASDGNEARAETIDAFRDQLVALANTQQNGRYLLGGTETLTPPFLADGTYQGNDAEVLAPIDTTSEVGATIVGTRAFQDGGDLIGILTQLSADLRSGNLDGVAAALPSLDTAISGVSNVRADVGTRMNTIDAFAIRHGDEALRLTQSIADIEDADLAQVAVDLSAAETQGAALSTTAARVLGRSLFDFLG
jgi:flagellar hook-associated protein 3 FlgL